MDSNAVFAILLLIAGIGILGAEVFIPSGGLLGITTFFTLLISVVFAYRAWWNSSPALFWLFVVALLVLVPATLVTAFSILPHTSVGKRVLLEAPAAEDVTPFQRETSRLLALVGQFGTAASTLNPGGVILVEGERHHAYTEGLIVDAGQSVQVLEVRGTRLLVRPATPPSGSAPVIDPSARLDFEFPQG